MVVPILIDNGSFQCRVGYTSDEAPTLVFKNVIAKLRKERGKRDVEIQVGNEIENLDAVRFALKSQFDRHVVIHMEVQETVFDYMFSTLNITTEEKIENPLLITEPFLNPNYCRHLMSELLFECYQIPSLCYGVDGLFSLYNNYPNIQNSLVLSFGNHTIHILPFVNGKVDPENSRRINLGGSEMAAFLHRLLQLKYPAHVNTITLGKVEDILYNHSYIADDYSAELDKWANVEFYNENVLRLQLPTKCQPSVSQIEVMKEKRKEIAKKMVEMNAKKRGERLAADEERLLILNEIKDLAAESDDTFEVQRALKVADVSNFAELKKTISTLKGRIYKIKYKMKEYAQSCSSTQTSTTSISSSTEIKSKITKETKDPESIEKLDSWLSEIRQKRTEILKKRAQRKQKRTDMAKRRTAAAQERMRILSQLAKKEKHDTFGMKDEDWDVYKVIQKDGGGTDSEDEQEELNELEQVLKTHDPTFVTEAELEAKAREEDHELHIGLEKVRAPELIFQPSMIGESQCGLVETIDNVLKLYPSETQDEMVNRIFLTGGMASFSGLTGRLKKDLMPIRPFESSFNIFLANDPVLDVWNGMKKWISEESNLKYFVTKKEYDEYGGEYFKQHSASNIYYPSPHNALYNHSIVDP